MHGSLIRLSLSALQMFLWVNAVHDSAFMALWGTSSFFPCCLENLSSTLFPHFIFSPKEWQVLKIFFWARVLLTRATLGCVLQIFVQPIGRGHAQEFWDGEVSVLGALFAQPLLVWWSQGQRWRQTLGKEFEFVCAPAFPNVVHPEFWAFIPNEISKYKFAAFSSSFSQRAQHGILMQTYFQNGPARQSAFFPFPFSQDSARLTLS